MESVKGGRRWWEGGKGGRLEGEGRVGRGGLRDRGRMKGRKGEVD